MPVVSVAELKAQLNLDHDLDDALLASKIAAAEHYCQSFIGPWNSASIDSALFNQAVLMLAAYWYETREAAQVGGNPYAVPFGVHDMLQPLRQWVV
ncbi:head-tail connector protein [Pseudothioclava arenosa]|uniref:Phage gp6-like head-tail connector protein n=1 Tax=Pseudothioclava arenosa TaxID=1795308 RepID=A0A2A4CJN1_9RHOB|nr:head-tail connector protein [Pseudothioclava arenosa]PCD76233.1 hypothetical protein CLN94_10435 [Pseudothioclava arenosa]